MAEHPLGRVLSKALALDPAGWRIIYTHRGAPEDKMEVTLAEILKIERGSFLLKDGETQIPFHRVLWVTDGKGTVHWRKRMPEGIQAQGPLSSRDRVSQAHPQHET